LQPTRCAIFYSAVQIIWEAFNLHFDDKLWPRGDKKVKSPREIEINVKASARVILQPKRR